MKSKQDESCEDCIFMDRRTGQRDRCCLPDQKQNDPKRAKQSFNSTCDDFKPNQMARIARSLHTIAWNIEELGNMTAAEQHVNESSVDDDETL